MTVTQVVETVISADCSAVFYGALLPTANVLDAVQARYGAGRALDWRAVDDAVDGPARRRQVAQALRARGCLVVLLSHDVPAELRAIIDETLRGHLNVGPGDVLKTSAPVMALVPGSQPPEDIAAMFDARIGDSAWG